MKDRRGDVVRKIAVGSVGGDRGDGGNVGFKNVAGTMVRWGNA